MSAMVGGLVLAVLAFLTAMLSGVFGMAGGLVLMGGLAFLMPVSAAFVTHGLLQLVANGWRAILQARHVHWRIVAFYGLSSLAAGIAVALIAFTPSKMLLFLMLGLVPGLLWIPQSWLRLDAARPLHALTSGFLVAGLNLTAGVAGPLLDIFFVRTDLTRHAIVATKAATQVFSHLAKILVYGAPLIAAGAKGLPSWQVFAVAIPLSMLGTAAGGRILDRMSDVNFKAWTRWIVTFVGLTYLVQAAQLYLKGHGT
jgi:uncharacterized membrane protein YfcA